MVASVVREIWSVELDLIDFSDDDDFFTLGGHSLIMVEIQGSIAHRLGIEVPMDELFRRPTVSQISAYIVSLNTTR